MGSKGCLFALYSCLLKNVIRKRIRKILMPDKNGNPTAIEVYLDFLRSTSRVGDFISSAKDSVAVPDGLIPLTVSNLISRFSRIGILAKISDARYQIQPALFTLKIEEINDKVRALNASTRGSGKARGPRPGTVNPRRVRTPVTEGKNDFIEVDAIEILEQLKPEGLVALMSEMVRSLRADKMAMVERVSAETRLLVQVQRESERLRREIVDLQERLINQGEELAKLRATRGGGVIERRITVQGPRVVAFDVGVDNAASGGETLEQQRKVLVVRKRNQGNLV